MGGSLTAKSEKFVSKLFKQKLIDRVETRNIELKLNTKVLEKFEDIINSIFKFELDWLKFKQKLQKSRKMRLKNDNSERIKVLNKRFK